MGAYGLAWPMGCKKVVWMSVHGLETGPADARFSRRLGSIETVSGELGWRGASWGLVVHLLSLNRAKKSAHPTIQRINAAYVE